jgi:hypothetical protein
MRCLNVQTILHINKLFFPAQYLYERVDTGSLGANESAGKGVFVPLIDPDTPDDGFAFLDEASAAFLRAIKQHYTRDTAVDAMEALVPVLGKDWKARLILGIVSNKYPNVRHLRIRIDPHNNSYQKINAIKELRAVTGMGLVDAKHAVESAVGNWVDITLPVKPEGTEQSSWQTKIMSSVNYLRQCGVNAEFV